MAESKVYASRESESILRDHIKKPWRNHDYPEAWRNLPEIPHKDEINRDLDQIREDSRFGKELKWNDYMRDPEYYHAKLPHNIIDGPWPSKLDYVSAHYQILREDAIAPLRNAVAYYKSKPGMMEDQETAIYTHVTIKGLQLSPMGAAFRIEFSNERAGKRIRWEQSKRLIQGSLVALSPQKDNFKSICKVGVVAARPIPGGLDQNPPQIDIFFAEDREVVFDPAIEYVMIEAHSSYFEASRGMLEAMQKLMTEKFSLAPHLAHLDTDVTEPQHVADHPIFNLAPLLLPEVDKERVVDGKYLTLEESLERVDILGDFPDLPESGMDSSQVKALQNMLTKKVSIIQGPPGTGKTFVSVNALKVLLASLEEDGPPIIVSAQTNHALDQLLNHVLKFEPEILRLGGRSSKENEEIRKRTMYELRQHEKFRNAGGWGAVRFANRAVDDIVAIIQNLMHPLTRDIVDMRSLFNHGIVSKTHYDSLQGDDWDGENMSGDSFENWLPVDAFEYIPRTPPINSNLELEDGEIQQEALAALEAEASGGAAGTLSREEMEREALTGTWIGFARERTGRTTGMDDREVKKLLKSHKSLHTIQAARRGDVYRYWLKKLDIKIKGELRTQLANYRAAIDDLRLAKWSANISLIKAIGIKLIGCTTTGLSKYRGLIAALHPRTILIEEAAETLEGTVIAGMVDSLCQLILVGDHKQLQANCNVASLGVAPYNMNVSMFERLVNNKIPYVMLNKQRRMIPEIRKLLCVEPNPFYKNLYDDESVHNYPEAVNSDNSKYNLDEAEMLVGHFVHLVLNGTPVKKITALTFYNGQRKTIIQELKKHPALKAVSYFNCFTVDSYQGEENDIILLSLVRSNNSLNIGFLENKNRVVVALSRARCGFYLFGNALTLASAETNETSIGREPLWLPLIDYMAEHKLYDLHQGLPITCQNHNKTLYLHEATDWLHLAGGCHEKCPGTLACDHVCPLNCHPFDHEEVRCSEPCPKQLLCGHGCSSTCRAQCRCDACQVIFTEDMDAVDMNMPDPDLPWLDVDEPLPSSPQRNKRGDHRGRGRGRERGGRNQGGPRDIRNEEPNFPSTHNREGSMFLSDAEVDARKKAWRDLKNTRTVIPNVVEPSDEASPSQHTFKETFREVNVKDDGRRLKKRGVETILGPTKYDAEFPELGKKAEKVGGSKAVPVPRMDEVDVLAKGHEMENLHFANTPKKSAFTNSHGNSIANANDTANYNLTANAHGTGHTNSNSNDNSNSSSNGNSNTNFYVAPPTNGNSRFSVITDDLRNAFVRVKVTPSLAAPLAAASDFGGSGPASSPPRTAAGYFGGVDGLDGKKVGDEEEFPVLSSRSGDVDGGDGFSGVGGYGGDLLDLEGWV